MCSQQIVGAISHTIPGSPEVVIGEAGLARILNAAAVLDPRQYYKKNKLAIAIGLSANQRPPRTPAQKKHTVKFPPNELHKSWHLDARLNTSTLRKQPSSFFAELGRVVRFLPSRVAHLRSSLKSSSPSLEALRPSATSIGPDRTQNNAAEEGSARRGQTRPDRCIRRTRVQHAYVSSLLSTYVRMYVCNVCMYVCTSMYVCREVASLESTVVRAA